MDKKFEGFLNAYLDAEQTYDTSGYLRPALLAFSESYVQVIREGFIDILQDENFGPAEYERLTNIEFPDGDSLRRYLQDMYSYLFKEAPTQPSPSE